MTWLLSWGCSSHLFTNPHFTLVYKTQYDLGQPCSLVISSTTSHSLNLSGSVGCAALKTTVPPYKKNLFLVHIVSFWDRWLPDIHFPFDEWPSFTQDLSNSLLQEKRETGEPQMAFHTPLLFAFIGQKSPISLTAREPSHVVSLCVQNKRGKGCWWVSHLLFLYAQAHWPSL